MRLPQSQAVDEGPNLTPVIDIVFLLLIFFLVATKFDQQEKDMSIQIAEVLKATPMAMGPKELVVNVNKKGEYLVMGKTVSKEGLSHIIQTESKNGRGKVQIRADENVKFRYPLNIMGLCKLHDVDYTCTVLEKKP
ncbi:MAG: biopolymer transporter ExbD [Planctomycetota bacterium]|nr:biopolymer transporter ExbD [Planctomycetota bacterium]